MAVSTLRFKPVAHFEYHFEARSSVARRLRRVFVENYYNPRRFFAFMLLALAIGCAMVCFTAWYAELVSAGVSPQADRDFLWRIDRVVDRQSVPGLVGLAIFYAFLLQACFLAVGALRQSGPYRIARLAEELRRNGRADEAVALMKEEVEAAPRDAALIAHLAAACADAGRPEKAEQLFRQALELEPDLVEALYGLGFCTLGIDPLSAFAYFDKAVRRAPRLPVLLEARGLAALALGRVEDAVRDFTTAIGLRPESVSAWINRGVAFASVGDNLGAESDFSEAVRLAPHNTTARGNLAAIYGRMQRFGESAEQLERIIERYPNNARHRVELAYLYRRIGQMDRAIAALEAAHALQPANTDVLMRMAMLYDLVGRRVEAAELAERAEKLDPALRGGAKLKELESITETLLFRDLPLDDVQRLTAAGRIRTFEDGELLMKEGEQAEELFIVQEGEVEVRQNTVAGRSNILNQLGKGSVIGEIAFIDRGKRSASVVAKGTCKALELRYSVIDAFLAERPLSGHALLKNIARVMAGRIRLLDDDMRDRIVWSFTPSEPE